MRKFLNLWSYYSGVYDVLNEFQPYNEHLDLLCSLLNPQSGGLYLDAGCGTGNLALRIYKSGCRVIGIDHSYEMLACANRKNDKIDFRYSNLDQQLSFVDNYFDGVVSNNVMAYLQNPDIALAEIHRVLKPGAIFVVATLRENWSPMAVYKEHCRHKGLLHTAKIFFPLIGLGIFNVEIIRRIKKGKYRTYNEKTFLELLDKFGFINISVLFSYAKQDLVVVCRK